MYHCENYGDNQDRYERCDESNRHKSIHFFPSSEYGRVLADLIDKSWRQPEHQETKGKRRDRATTRRQRET
jgi:hypothetical protein